MRLHELTVTAFGPFVETVHVDFDELTSGGLFLLTGDTGAGKSSILDAVCFALYGEVPGDRSAARHLRSDHAAPEAEPRVVLRVGINGRTFRFTRSPAWDRPRRRGDGTRRIQAHVVVEEQRADGWSTLTNRLDEAGHLVTHLLGMTCTQFTQVAMLPQGRFQTFLRASSAERHAVLQRLFRTRRYEDVERWLVDRRVALRRRSQEGHEATAAVLNRFQEAAGVGVPLEWELSALDAVAEDGSLPVWADGLTTAAAQEHAEAAGALERASTRLDDVRTAVDQARRQAEARARGERAAHALSDLATTQQREIHLRDALERHRRSEPVVPLARRAESATLAADRAGTEARLRVVAAGPLLPETQPDTEPDDGFDLTDPGDSGPDLPAPDVVQERARRAREERAVAASWLPRERELATERTRVATLGAEAERLRVVVAGATSRQEQGAPRRAALVDDLTRARGLASRRAEDRGLRDLARTALQAAGDAEGLTARLARAREALDAATAHAHDLREAYLDARERRISGMAAELAGGLAVGCSCPVCGSADHPAPASATARVGRDDEEAARSRHESADFERQTVQESVATLTAQLASARDRSQGQAPDHWRRELDEAARRLEQSTTAEAEADLLADQLDRLDLESRRDAETLATARATLRERVDQQAEAQERAGRLEAELNDLLAEHEGALTVAQAVASLDRRVTLLEDAHDALLLAERARAESVACAEVADASAARAGFASVEDAVAHALPPRTAAELLEELDARTVRRAAAGAALDEEAVAQALAAPAPDLDGLRVEVASAASERDARHADAERLSRRHQRLGVLASDLDDALVAWAPTRHEHAVVASLSALVEGKSADNRLRMRLSAYVLSERLRQVVAAANERLAGMTDERYTLEQSDEKGAGEQRGGLSLRVRDEWSGKERDPVTLSGGETFLVSLALALGLADTVSHEAGGAQLDTLFIDEGFGALDAGTLDAVMDTLDALRDGGRVVGLVSHVAELRNRVTSQLEVRKDRQGSTVRLALADG